MYGGRSSHQRRTKTVLKNRDPSLINVDVPLPSIPVLSPLLDPIISGEDSSSNSPSPQNPSPSTSKTSAPQPSSSTASSGSSSSGTSGSSPNNGSSSAGSPTSSGGGNSSSGNSNSSGNGSNSGTNNGSGNDNSSGENSTSDNDSGNHNGNTSGANIATSNVNTSGIKSSPNPNSASSSSTSHLPSRTNASSGSSGSLNANSSPLSSPQIANFGVNPTTVTSLAPSGTASSGHPETTGASSPVSSGNGDNGDGNGDGNGTVGSSSDSHLSSHNLSAGAIAGIVIGCLVVVVALLILFVRRRSRNRRAARLIRWAVISNNGYDFSSSGSTGSMSQRSSFATNYDIASNSHPTSPVDVLPEIPAMAEIRDTHTPGYLTHSQSIDNSPLVISFDSERSTNSDPYSQNLVVPPPEAILGGNASLNIPPSPTTPNRMSVRPFSPSELFSFPKPPKELAGGAINPFNDPEIHTHEFGDTEIVRRPFVPSLDDELWVETDDKVRILRIFSDSWALVEKVVEDNGKGKVRALESQAPGLIPVDCFRQAGEDYPAFLTRAKRISSIGAQAV